MARSDFYEEDEKDTSAFDEYGEGTSPFERAAERGESLEQFNDLYRSDASPAPDRTNAERVDFGEQAEKESPREVFRPETPRTPLTGGVRSTSGRQDRDSSRDYTPERPREPSPVATTGAGAFQAPSFGAPSPFEPMERLSNDPMAEAAPKMRAPERAVQFGEAGGAPRLFGRTEGLQGGGLGLPSGNGGIYDEGDPLSALIKMLQEQNAGG